MVKSNSAVALTPSANLLYTIREMASEDDMVPLKTMDSLDVDEAKLDFVFGNYARRMKELMLNWIQQFCLLFSQCPQVYAADLTLRQDYVNGNHQWQT